MADVIKVLVVDDEVDLLDAIVLALEMEGYEVKAVSDPCDAVEMACAWLPHIVMTDLMMPVKSGYELVAEMRDRPELRGVKILLSSLITPTMRQAHGGWDEFLRKPFECEELLASLRKLSPAEV